MFESEKSQSFVIVLTTVMIVYDNLSCLGIREDTRW